MLFDLAIKALPPFHLILLQDFIRPGKMAKPLGNR